MNNKVTCCKNCGDRHYNCHSECKEYNDQKPVYKEPEDNAFREYWADRSNKCEHKKYQQKRR